MIAGSGTDLATLARDLARAGVGVEQQRRVIAAALDAGAQPDVATVLRRLATTVSAPRLFPDDAPTGRRAHGTGERTLLAGRPGYPPRLFDAWPELGAPAWIFVRGPAGPDGSLPALGRTRPAVAVVGTRQATADGLRTAHDLGLRCAMAGVTVVSGLARGVDQAAHRGALEGGGATVAVLGTGSGVDYPRGDAGLRAEIAAAGGLVTELPPGAPPRPRHFLARNRIISGLVDAVVVVEGRNRSGALHTARMAAGQGRDVWAVPGSLNAATSAAPLALVRDGAQVVTALDDVIAAVTTVRREAGPTHPAAEDAPAPGSEPGGPDPLGPVAARVDALLGVVPVSLDDLARRAGLDTTTVLRTVAQLVRAGRARHAPGGIERAH